MNRRTLLRNSALALIATQLPSESFAQPTDDELLEEISRLSFKFFWEHASPTTGQVKDRATARVPADKDTHRMSSIAATGFGLTALSIADWRRYMPREQLVDRVRRTLRFLADKLENVHGFYYHFIDIESGARWEKVELSSIDTSLLLCGVLTARGHFDDAEIKQLATKIYERVDWPWMLNGADTFSMGWHPEKGFLSARWEHYCELMMIYLLALGSPTHPVPAKTWHAWKRTTVEYAGIQYISGHDPLFTHQYSQAWFDFRNKHDQYADYFENSVKATRAHKKFCLSLNSRFPDYSDDLWGISASDSAHGYTAWGGPPELGQLDGSIVPCAPGGSVPFLPADCIRVLRTMREKHAQLAWTPYSYTDVFNPLTNWTNPDVLGIDLGITLVMIENHRTQFVWNTFMKNPETKVAFDKAGFKPNR